MAPLLVAALTFGIIPQGFIPRAYKHPVTTWVAPYAVAKSRAQLTADLGMKDALTHLALQFWQPTKDGWVEKVAMPEVNDAAIVELRDWAHKNGIRAMLCVYNGAGSTWDWPLAKAGFAENRTKFVNALIAEMDRMKLDGIDMDLEGNGELEADKGTYLSFMTELSKALRQRRKHLTVDTFAYVWHAPNQKWWPELLPLVDALTSMGYEETGSAAQEWRSFEAQRKAAGLDAAKLQIGMPSDKDKWQGSNLADHLEWVQKDGQVGVAIWDAQLPAPSWRVAETWKTLAAIRGSKAE